MASAIQQAVEQFHKKPVFDESLGSALAALELRKRAALLTDARKEHWSVPRAHTAVAPPQDSLAELRNRSAQNEAARGYGMPPVVQRPWSVEQLVRRSAALGNKPASPNATQRKGPAGLLMEHPDRVAQFQAGGLPSDPYWSDNAPAGTRRQHEETKSRRGTAHRLRRDRHGANSDDENRRFGPQYYASQGALQAATSEPHRSRSSGSEASRGSSVFEPDTPQHAGSAHFDPRHDESAELPDDLLTAHIERANARRSLQESRLAAMGIRAPNGRVEGGMQTDEGDDVFLGSRSRPRADHDGFGDEWSQGPTGGHFPPETGTLLEPQTPLMAPPVLGYGPSQSTRNVSTVWQHVLNEEKAAAATPNASTAAVDDAWFSIIASNANAPAATISAAMSRAATAQSHASHPTQQNLGGDRAELPAAKAALVRQLEQLQLGNEEVLLRNHLLRDPLPSSAGGAFRVKEGLVAQEDDEQLTRQAVAHVAAAYNDPAARERALKLFAPTGGHGSVTDRRKADVAPVGHDTERWMAARAVNDRRRIMETDGEPLRQWAAQLPTKYLQNSSEQANDGIPIRTFRSVQNEVPQNAAKRKWENVSFQGPRHLLPAGTIEQLSAQARSAMSPDAYR